MPLSPRRPAPRLYAGPECFSRLEKRRRDPWFTPYFQAAADLAQRALHLENYFPEYIGHNWHLIRARTVQIRIATLAVQAHLTGDDRYVRAALRYVEEIRNWEYWSWISWRQKNSDPCAIYDLSYGENSASLAIAYDWLQEWLTPDDEALIVETSRRAVDSFLKHTANPVKGTPSPWNHPFINNWTAVCAGGMGMLALSLYELLPESSEVLRRVEFSMALYMEHIHAFGGGCPEGVGYWNYGMRYAWMYLRSYENSTGEIHKCIEHPLTRATLTFPLDFSPYQIGCGFGDGNHWRSLPFHHEMAHRLNAPEIAAELRRVHEDPTRGGPKWDYWADAVETILLAPDLTDLPAEQSDVIKVYDVLDWGILADRMPQPSLYLSARGGTTELPHGHRDLTTFHVVIDGESAITSPGVNEYLDSTFGPRRYETYDTIPMSKNVVLINGLGISEKTEVVTRKVDFSPSCKGIHIDATGAMGVMHDVKAVNSYCRLYLMIDRKAFLVLDSLDLPHPGRCESRLHTGMTAVFLESVVQLTGQKTRCSFSLGCNHSARLYNSIALSTLPKPDPVHVIRWITAELHRRVVFASLITAEESSNLLSVSATPEGVGVEFSIGRRGYSLSFSSDLRHSA